MHASFDNLVYLNSTKYKCVHTLEISLRDKFCMESQLTLPNGPERDVTFLHIKLSVIFFYRCTY